MPDRPEPPRPEKLFCAKVNVTGNPGSNAFTFDLSPLDINDIPQAAKDHISNVYGQNVLQDLLNTYPQYPQGSSTLDITIDAPTFIVYQNGPNNWFFREDGQRPPMDPPGGQGYGPEFGPVLNFVGQTNQIESYGLFAKFMKPNGDFKFDIFMSVFQPVAHETKIIIDPKIKNNG